MAFFAFSRCMTDNGTTQSTKSAQPNQPHSFLLSGTNSRRTSSLQTERMTMRDGMQDVLSFFRTLPQFVLTTNRYMYFNKWKIMRERRIRPTESLDGIVLVILQTPIPPHYWIFHSFPWITHKFLHSHTGFFSSWWHCCCAQGKKTKALSSLYFSYTSENKIIRNVQTTEWRKVLTNKLNKKIAPTKITITHKESFMHGLSIRVNHFIWL